MASVRGRGNIVNNLNVLRYDAEIDSYIDSIEYQDRFGQEVVPYLHGWDYPKGLEGRQFSWLMQLAHAPPPPRRREMGQAPSFASARRCTRITPCQWQVPGQGGHRLHRGTLPRPRELQRGHLHGV